MAKYIEVHDQIINIESISKVEFVSDDIYLGLFPTSKEGEILIDFIDFTFAKIELFTGETIGVQIDLYQPEENESTDNWIKRNRACLNISWSKLIASLGKIEKITGYEYMELDVN